MNKASKTDGHHQAYQYMDNRSHRKRIEKILEEIMAKNFPNLMKTLIYTSKKFRNTK